MSAKPDSKPNETPSPIGEISQEPSALESFLDANQKKLVIIGVLAILILVGYVIFDGLQQMKTREEAAAVAAARTVPEYEKVSEKLAGKTAGGSALILKSQLLWDDQQQQEAIATLEEVIADYPDHPAIGSAYASLGSFQQQLGNLAEAKEAFTKSAEAQSAASSYALLSLGDLARQAGENDEAKAYYDRIITEYEDSHFQVKNLARNRIELIGVKSPVEKAPEPAQPQGQPQPGDFSPPVGLPDVSPTPQPADEPTPKPTGEMKDEATPDEASPSETTTGETTTGESKPEGESEAESTSPADEASPDAGTTEEKTPGEAAAEESPKDGGEASETAEPTPAPADEPAATEEGTEEAPEATPSSEETPAEE